MVRIRLLGLVPLLLIATATHGQVLVPLEFTVTEQTLNWGACGQSLEANGGPDLSLTVSVTCASGSINGVAASSNVDGRLVLSFAGTVTSASSEMHMGGPFVEGKLNVSVPSTNVAAATLPTTEIFGVVTSSAIGLGIQRVYGQWDLYGGNSQFGPTFSSILGSGYQPFAVSTLTVTTLQGVGYFNSREVEQFHLVAGDTVTLPLRASMNMFASNTSSQSFSETTTFELQYLPEPSSSFMLPPGAALLAMLAHYRGR